MKDREDLLRRAATHLRAGRVAAAKEVLEGLLQENSCDLEALGLMGAASMIDGDPAKAEAYYRAILKQRSDDLRATLELSDALYDQGKIDSAIECAESILSRDESCLAAHQNAATGHLQKAQDHAAAAATHYSKLIGSSEYADRARRGLFLALLAMGEKLQEAVDILHHALEDNPSILKLHLYMSLCHHFSDNIEKTAAECSVAIGMYFFAKGDLAKAADAYRAALALDQENEWAHYHLGMTLWSLGKPSEALPHVQEALRLRPTFSRAGRSLAELRLVCNREGRHDN